MVTYFLSISLTMVARGQMDISTTKPAETVPGLRHPRRWRRWTSILDTKADMEEEQGKVHRGALGYLIHARLEYTLDVYVDFCMRFRKIKIPYSPQN
jgi:hypothetical protein